MKQERSGRPKVVAAATTPFKDDGALDLEGAAELYRAVAGSGVDGLFVGGTTGEFPTLSAEERELLMAVALQNESRVEVFPHVGAASVREAVRLTRYAVEKGAVRVAAVTPWFWPLRNAELESYYRAVAEAAEGRDVYAYSIPSVANNRVDGDLVRRLLDVANFAGVKVSVPDTDAILELVEASEGRLRIFSGDDTSALTGWGAGSSGMVSGPGTAIPQPYVALADAVAAGDEVSARHAQGLIDLYVDATGGDIGLIKLTLQMLGLPGGPTRASLPAPTAEDRWRIEAAMQRIRDELELLTVGDGS